MSSPESLYSFVNNPNSKRRDLLNLAVENIELIKRTDNLKELRERKKSTLDALRKEIEITSKAIRHFHGLMPVKIRDKEEKIQVKVEKKKIVHEHEVHVQKLSGLDFELENIRDKLNKLNF